MHFHLMPQKVTVMVAAPPPPLKISDQNNWGGGDLSKILNLGGAKFKGLNLRGDLKF